MSPHAIRLVVSDDLARSRLTVFFRLLLALPHFVWLVLYGSAALLVGLVNWIATLVEGISPAPVHEFLAGFVRYATHVGAYLFLAANPYPGFTGKAGSYPVDVEIDPPARQNRWTVAFRIPLALPAILIAAGLLGGGGGRSSASWGGGVAATVAILGWFACLAQGRMPRGFRDVQVYCLRYSAQLDGYLFLLTGRYPDSDPGEPGVDRPHPVRISVADDLHRSRLTVFFRLFLTVPHIVWLLLWSIAAILAALAAWLVALASGRTPRVLHRFLAAYVRYETHVLAYLLLIANLFPGFTGMAGSYPVDVEIDPPARQNRWITGFRLPLAVPALAVSGAISTILCIAGFLGWFASLATGRMPRGLRNVGAYALRYSAQTNAYLYVLTDRYPYSGPPA